MIGEYMIRRFELIGELDDDDRRALLDVRGELRNLERGEDLLKDGGEPAFSVVVIDGLLQRYKINPQGKRQIHSFYLPTDTPSLETLPIEVMDNTLGAAAPSRVGLVSRAEMWRIMGERPNVLKLVWRETLVQAATFREWLMRNSQLLAHAQLAHFFCEIFTRAKAAGLARGDTFDLPLMPDDIADALGMSVLHVNRTRSLLQASGLVSFEGGRLKVPDLGALAEAAEFDGRYLHLHRSA